MKTQRLVLFYRWDTWECPSPSPSPTPAGRDNGPALEPTALTFGYNFHTEWLYAWCTMTLLIHYNCEHIDYVYSKYYAVSSGASLHFYLFPASYMNIRGWKYRRRLLDDDNTLEYGWGYALTFTTIAFGYNGVKIQSACHLLCLSLVRSLAKSCWSQEERAMWGISGLKS